MLSKRFFKKFWRRLVLNKKDYVQSHDCHELLYKQFTQWSHAPSTSLLPLPMEGFYPVEPYLAWRLSSLFIYRSDGQMELIFYANPQICSLFDFHLFFDRLSFVTITVDDETRELTAYNEDDYSQSQCLTKQDILALVFELLMMPWCSISLFGIDYRDDWILQTESKHKIINYPDDYLKITTHNGM